MSPYLFPTLHFLLFFLEPPEDAGVASSLAAAFLLPLLLGVPCSFLAFSASLAALFFLARSAFSFSSISLFSFSMREMRVLHLQEKMASLSLQSHLLHIFNSLKTSR